MAQTIVSSPFTDNRMTLTVTHNSHGFDANDIGKAVRSSGTDGQFVVARANSAPNAEVVGVITSIDTANQYTITTSGFVDVVAAVPTATAGTVFFLAEAADSQLTSTEPTTVGAVSKPVAVITESNAKMLLIHYRGEVLTSTTQTNAPNDAQYVTLAVNGDLSAERVLTAGSGISLTDAGANGAITIANTASSTTINTNADNRVITGSGTANTLNGETNLTYDGSELTVGGTSAKLVLDQSSGDGYIFELRSSDVAHGLSGYNTATYGQFMKKHADSGMLQIWGFSDANANQAIGLSLVGVSGIAANTTKTSAAIGIVEILGGIKGNGNISNPASNGNILVVRDAASGDAKMIVDMEGDVRVKENSSMPSVTKGAAKAWLSYDYGGGTPTAYASYNVASLGDDGTGHVQMNFTTAMESVHYSIVGMPSATRATMNASTLLTGSADFKIWHSNDTLADIDGGIAIFGEAT